MNEPWERQKGESHKAYEAFARYRDMGPSRSIAKVAKELGKSTQLLERWSRKWNWVSRAQQYDDYVDRQKRLEQEEERKKMAERHAKQAMMFQNKIIERMRTLRPEELSPSDLAKWFDIAVKIERLSRGESTEVAEVEHSGQVTKRHEYDVFHRVEQYEEIYRKLAERSAPKGNHEGDYH